MTIELVPGLSNPDIKMRFEGLLLNCISLKGCVAFWTIDVNYFNFEALLNALKKPNSYYCVDIQLPTNIRNLANHVNAGASEIYLHQYRLDPSVYNLNTNLLHSKIALFELKNNEVEIWIGSHNFTNYALSGINLEASTVIRCTKSDKIYYETLGYIEYVKNSYCEKFDLNKMYIYEQLQTRNAEKTMEFGGVTSIQEVVNLVGIDMELLEKEKVLQLLSVSNSGFSKLKKHGETVFLHTYDINSQKENLYVCKVSQFGEVNLNNPKLVIDFVAPRRFAFIAPKKFSFLKQSMQVGKEILKVSKYFVNLTIQYQIENFEVFEKLSQEDLSLWQFDKNSPYKGRADNSNLERHIQKATYNHKIKPVSVSIGHTWNSNKKDFTAFFRQLDELINEEYHLSQFIMENDIERNFEDLLKGCYNHLNLPMYAKAHIERIILEKGK